ncbi:hypothetical protein ACU4GD_19935 [Cupriavidus basilensis]
MLAIVIPPVIAFATHSRYFIARSPVDFGPRHKVVRCTICRNPFEVEDVAACPAYRGPICSLCCTLDARCGDRCKPGASAQEQIVTALTRVLPAGTPPVMARRIGQFLPGAGGHGVRVRHLPVAAVHAGAIVEARWRRPRCRAPG